jgi:hypothetical protein
MQGLKRLFLYLFLVTSLLPVIPLAGCSGKTPPDNNRFIELLKLLPATEKGGGFALIDYELWRQVNGISLFNSNGQEITREEYFDIISHKPDLFGFESWAFSNYYGGGGNYADTSPMQDKYIGYDVMDINAEINNDVVLSRLKIGPGGSFIDSPPDFLDVQEMKMAAIGNFNPKDTSNALNNRDEWPPWLIDGYTQERYRNVTINNWVGGNENHLQNRFGPPHLDSLGRARPLAVSDGHLFVGSSVNAVKTMIDANQGKSSTLADIPEYALVAQGLYDLNSKIAGVIGDGDLVNWYWKNSGGYKGPLLKNYLSFGSGFGKDEKGEYIALVLVHDNPDDAIKNISLLEQRIDASFREDINFNTENLTIETKKMSDYIYDKQIYTEGRVLLAKLYTNDPLLWAGWFTNDWQLGLHENNTNNKYFKL